MQISIGFCTHFIGICLGLSGSVNETITLTQYQAMSNFPRQECCSNTMNRFRSFVFFAILSTLPSSICPLLSGQFTFLRNQCGKIAENNRPRHLIGKFQSSGSTIGSNRMRRLRKLWYVYLEQYIFKVYSFYFISVHIYQPNSTCCILTSACEL